MDCGAGNVNNMLEVWEGASMGDNDEGNGTDGEAPVVNARRQVILGPMGKCKKGTRWQLDWMTCEATHEVVGLFCDGREN